MKNARTIKELLELLLANTSISEDNIVITHNGLCFVLSRMERNVRGYDYINEEEFDILMDYIRAHRPITFIKYYPYYWAQGDYINRIRWIKKHIKLNT